MKRYLPSIFASLGIIVSVSLILLQGKHIVKTVQSATADHPVISEVQISGTSAGNDFIELYNPSDSAFDLNGHRLVKRTATGSADTSIKSWNSETLIPAKGYYLWANSDWTPAVAPDASTSATIAANNGVALRQGAEDVGIIVDSVAWGTAANAFVEGSVFASNPASGESLERKACQASTSESMSGVDQTNGNAEDTNNNSVDFVLKTSSNAQNLQSSTEVPGCASATASPSATPTASPTMTSSPTASPTMTASPTPTPTASPTVTSSPTSSPIATVTPTMSPTSTPDDDHGFPFPNRSFSCRVTYRSLNFGFFTLQMPMIRCGFF